MNQLATAADRLRDLGVTRLESYGWRDLDDPDAGGSEVHADEILRRWAAAGIEIVHRTSTADRARRFERNGYTVVQRGGRFDVFARVASRQLLRRRPRSTATLEIWNGVPWLGPIWAPRRRIVWLHHIHRDMWSDALPGPLAAGGRLLETRLAPPLYRRSRIVTLSDSSCEGIVAVGIPRDRVTIIPPGVHERFSPEPAARRRTPHVVVVGRLAPVKRQRLALDALELARRHCPDLTVSVVGDGPDRGLIEEWIAEHRAHDWVGLTGRIDDPQLVDEYRAAWLVLSASKSEGWGMSLTEGAACATPCVATDITGHRGAAIDGVTGRLVAASPEALGSAVVELVSDPTQRQRLAAGAVEHAATLSWTAVAAQHLDLLCDVLAERTSRQRSSGTT